MTDRSGPTKERQRCIPIISDGRIIELPLAYLEPLSYNQLIGMIKCDDYFTDHQNHLKVKTVHVQEWFTGQPLDRVFCRCYISPHHPGKSPVCTGPVPGEIWWPDWFSHESVVNKNHQNNQVKTCRSDVLILFCSCPIFWISVMLKDADFFFSWKIFDHQHY